MNDPRGPIILHTPLLLIMAALAAFVIDPWLAAMQPAPVYAVQGAWINFVIQIAIMIVASVISAALAPKPKPPKAASITDFDLPTAEEGREIPVVFGEVWITGPNVLWYGDLRSAPIKTKSGKK